MGCGGAGETKDENIEVHEVGDDEAEAEPEGVRSSVFVGPDFRINFYTGDGEKGKDHTVMEVMAKVNSALDSYEGWVMETKVAAMSSKWALADHLEYCGEDKLTELDGFQENADGGTLHLLAINAEEESLTIESYDAYGDDYYAEGEYWNGEGRHVITITDDF